MNKYLKSILKFIGLYLFLFVIVYFFLQPLENSFDPIWSYGFSYSIAKGEIPYLDFTMIIPPLYAFIMSIGLKIISTNFIVYLLEHTLILTITVVMLKKLYGTRVWLILFVFIFPLFTAITPTYNYFLFFLIVLIIYLEKKVVNENKHYYIGVLLGLTILTKHTVGVFFLIPSIIFYFKNKKILLKRFIGCIIPFIIFFIYLLVTNSLYEFFDLCVFGLLDFGKNNVNIVTLYFVLSIILIIINVIMIIKNKKNITMYYSLFSSTVLLPIFGDYHFFVYLLFFSLCVMELLKEKHNKIIFSTVLISMVYLILPFSYLYGKAIFTREINNFNYSYLLVNMDYYNSVNDLYNKYRKSGTTYFLSSKATFLKVVNDEKTNYFTILNKGNYGYDGTNKMIKKVSKMHNTYFIIDMYEYYEVLKNDYNQFDSDIINYVMKNSKKIDSLYDNYYVYYKE